MTTEEKSDIVAEGDNVTTHLEALENEEPEPKISASTIMAVFVSNYSSESNVARPDHLNQVYGIVVRPRNYMRP